MKRQRQSSTRTKKDSTKKESKTDKDSEAIKRPTRSPKKKRKTSDSTNRAPSKDRKRARSDTEEESIMWKKGSRKKQSKEESSMEDAEDESSSNRVGWKKGFEPPIEEEKLAAIMGGGKETRKKKGKSSAIVLPKLPAILDPCDDFLPLPEPSHQDDWLHQYNEKRQSFSAWKNSRKRNQVTPSTKTIYVVPLGSFEDRAPRDLCAKLIEFLKAYYYGMEIALLPSIDLVVERSSKGKRKRKTTADTGKPIHFPAKSTSKTSKTQRAGQAKKGETPKGEKGSRLKGKSRTEAKGPKKKSEDEKGTKEERKKKTRRDHKLKEKEEEEEIEDDENEEENSEVEISHEDENESDQSGNLEEEEESIITTIYAKTIRKTRTRDVPINLAIPWRVAHPFDLDKVDTSDNTTRQLSATTLLNVLLKTVPNDAYCVIGITMEDLYEDKKDSFVVGLAGTETRVGIFSFARYDPSFPGPAPSKTKKKKKKRKTKKSKLNNDDDERDLTLLSRSCKVLAHEVAHMFGITHCVYYSCCLNGSGHLVEDFAQPLHLCPVDLHKLMDAIGFDVKERYAALSRFYQENGMTAESEWIEKRLKSIEAKEEEQQEAEGEKDEESEASSTEAVKTHKGKEKEQQKGEEKKKKKTKKEKKNKKEKVTTAHTPDKGTQKATETLLKILREIMKEDPEKEGYSVTTVDDNIYKWHVKLFGWDAGTQIKEDMFLYESVTGKDCVMLEVLFPPNFPDNPPFLRVVYPRFHQYTGHITSGGSICIKDLTRSGWDPKFQLASFFIMIRNLLLEGGALVDMDNAGVEYSEEEARAAFARVAEAHGWKA